MYLFLKHAEILMQSTTTVHVAGVFLIHRNFSSVRDMALSMEQNIQGASDHSAFFASLEYRY